MQPNPSITVPQSILNFVTQEIAILIVTDFILYIPYPI